MAVDYHCALVGRLLLRVKFIFLFLLYNCSWAFITKDIIIATFWAFYTFLGIRLLIFHTKVVSKIIIIILLNLLDEPHVYKVLNLFFLILSPVVDNFALLVSWFIVRVKPIFLLLGFLSFKLIMMLLTVIILEKLSLMSFQLILSKLSESSKPLYGFLNNTFINSLAFDTSLNIAVTVPIGILLLLKLNRCVITSLSIHRFFSH